MAQEEFRASAKKASDRATRRELFQIGNALVWPVLLGAPAAKSATIGPLKPGPEITNPSVSSLLLIAAVRSPSSAHP